MIDFSMIFEKTPLPIAISDLNSNNLVAVNQSFVEFFKYSKKELIGNNSVELGLITQSTRNHMLAAFVNEGKNVLDNEIIATAKDGTKYAGKFNGGIIENENEQYLFSIFKDLTVIKKLTTDIADAESRQQAVLDNMPILSQPYIAWLKDLNEKYLMVNSAFAQFVNKKQEDILGKTSNDIFLAGTAKKLIFNNKLVLTNKKVYSFEEELEGTNGKLWYETSIAPVFSSNNKIIGTAGIMRDITKRKKTELEIMRLICQCSSQQQFSHADDRIDGGAYFVAHSCQKFSFGYLSCLCF